MRAAGITLLLLAAAPLIARGAEVVVVQRGKTFVPRAVSIRPGDSVVFRNEDGVNHNAFSDTAGLEFNLTAQAPGASNSFVFANEGVAEVRCAFHPAMRLTITVAR